MTIDLSTSAAGTEPDRAASIESTAASPESLSRRKESAGSPSSTCARRSSSFRTGTSSFLKLRFEHKRSAREIGEILDLGSEKQIYRKLDKLFDELRSMLLKGDLPADLYREAAEDIENLCRYGGVWGSDAPRGDDIDLINKETRSGKNEKTDV